MHIDSDKTKPSPRRAALESLGKRVARLRSAQGWTQQALAARLAVSRVAVSHIEMDLTIPSERTITLLAGLFKCSPHELVESTLYPRPKAERLPAVACCYTPLELELALLENDLAWLERLAGVKSTPAEALAGEIQQRWNARLADWAADSIDERERESIAAAQLKLAAAFNRSPETS
ncbi:MAG: helix-turn-helix transcriptional regulator [Chloroflexota bacterium]